MAKKHTWRERAEALGYDRNRLAELIGRDPITVWKWLTEREGTSRNSQRQLYVLILALENMTEKERAQWERDVAEEKLPAPTRRR